MVSVILNEQEYKNIKLLLEGKIDQVVLSKDIKKRLKKKSEHFIIINGDIYLKDEREGFYKRDFHKEQTDIMVLEAKRVHKDKHYGMNRFESNCNDLFFRIPRTILRKVVCDMFSITAFKG
ncbi:hypothetical protein NGRA_0192 [Nosema granulosis]|uniref:Uncharacterized protein n=1 Tax=Nosema granulosis TaxID=83296 RepID=A0A9P6KZT2_9MICR|nr:hypothetical protein NGRA_0192 [Nosema granulosis]